MNYQVWTKGDEYSGWSRKDCGDLPAALREVLAAIKRGQEPLLTVEVTYEISLNIKEERIEAAQSETELDKVAGGKSHGKVRRGDEAAPKGLDKGSGDNSAGPGAGD